MRHGNRSLKPINLYKKEERCQISFRMFSKTKKVSLIFFFREFFPPIFKSTFLSLKKKFSWGHRTLNDGLEGRNCVALYVIIPSI